MGRVLALDVGAKTIGMAMSDETGVFAFPGSTLIRHEGYRRDMQTIRDLVEANEVVEVVVGLPLMMDGSNGIQADKTLEFAEQLSRYVRVPIILQDERLSTSESEKVLITADRKRSQRKRTIDSMAASLILRSYLDSKYRIIDPGMESIVDDAE